MSSRIAFLFGAASIGLVPFAALAQEPPRGAQFPQGQCTGILCSTIGGSQAPQNQPQKSLFPEGQCGGVLCSAIGGSQAPRHAEAPPPCGGGLLCDMAPYGLGQPFIKSEAALQPQPIVATAPPLPVHKRSESRHHKPRKQTAKAN